MSAEQTWEIEDEHGKRTVTLAQFRAELDAKVALARPIMEALKRGDIEACGNAQNAMRVAL